MSAQIESLIPSNLIFLTIHGSQSYGLATENSDLDLKGIIIPPMDVEYHLFNKFEQLLNSAKIEEIASKYRNPNNPKIESTIYSLKKFFSLSAMVNPNMVELLWIDPKFYLKSENVFFEKLANNRQLFLSSRARYTFEGYAFAQLSRIERHRKWLVKGEIKKPSRLDYNLPEEPQRELSEVFQFAKKQIANWNLDKFGLNSEELSQVKDEIWDLVFNITQKEINWGNWPEIYEEAALHKLSQSLQLKDEIIHLIRRENQYKLDLNNYQSWLRWKKERNEERAKLEKKCGHDCKHSSHLIRLLKMAIEILENQTITTTRTNDKDELLAIKRGDWSYDQVMEYAQSLKNQVEVSYKTTKLPKVVDYQQINSLYHQIYSRFFNYAF